LSKSKAVMVKMGGQSISPVQQCKWECTETFILAFNCTRFLLHWLRNVRSMEEQCVLEPTMGVFQIV